MNKTPSPSVNEDYEAIEAAVLETARGRWFLAEYLRRHQAAETRALMDAIRKLENALGVDGQLSRNILSAMERTARTLAEIGREPFSVALPEAVLQMAEEAAAIAARMEKLGEEDGNAEKDLPALLSTQQHLMARKLEAVAGCLKKVSTFCGEETPLQTEEPEIGPEQARWFPSDSDLFEEDGPAAPADENQESVSVEAAPVADSAPVATPFAPENTPTVEKEESVSATDARKESSTGEEHTGHLSIIIEPGKPEKVHRESRIADMEETDRPRIIITRKRSSNEVDIPMATDEEDAGATAEREEEKSGA